MTTLFEHVTPTPVRNFMASRRLGRSDLSITPIGFGAWAIGGSGWEFGWGTQDDDESIAAIHQALELGVNWIDTAAAYGLGHSEEVVARALESWSGPRPYVFTKCGLKGDRRGNVYRSLRPNSIRRECEDSLRRLRVDAIDLYQIHWPVTDSNELADGWATMAQLQREGKVRWIGVSNFDVPQMRLAQQIAPIASLQPPYSLIRREIEQEILPFCLEEEIGVIVYSPMASGLLTGAMTRERAESLGPDDWRSRDPEFQEPRLSWNLELVGRLRAVGERHRYLPGQVAVAWALRHPAVTGAIVGARNPKQVDEIMSAPGFRLTEQEISEIEGEHQS
jgi:aryl-alcohol dehydrogenase-like predicted oxidoreductase